MSVKFKLDTRRFDSAFRQYVRRCKDQLHDIVNKKAFFIAKAAIMFTKRADKAEIAALGITYRTHSKKGKLLKRAKATISGTSRFRAIYAAGLRKKGVDPKSIPASEFESNMNRALGARMRSRGFLASGWLPAAKRLARVVKMALTGIIDAQQRGQPKGGVQVAEKTWHPVCVIANSAGQDVDSTESPDKVLAEGLQKAFDKEAASMEQYIIDRLNKQAS